MRGFSIERNDKGQPVSMTWTGDYEAPVKPTKAEKDAAKLAEHERIYGKRTAEGRAQ